MSIKLTAHNIRGVADNAKFSDVNLYTTMSTPGASAETEKGAKSYPVSGDPRVDLFFKSVRNMPCADFSADEGTEEAKEKYFEFLLEECWEKSALDTLRLGFYIRDCRGGKGEKLLFRAFCRWLLREHIHDLRINMDSIPFFGSWKDLLIVFLGTSQESRAILQLATQLKDDKVKLGTKLFVMAIIAAASRSSKSLSAPLLLPSSTRSATAFCILAYVNAASLI